MFKPLEYPHPTDFLQCFPEVVNVFVRSVIFGFFPIQDIFFFGFHSARIFLVVFGLSPLHISNGASLTRLHAGPAKAIFL